MSDSVNILRNMESFDKAEQFDGFSRVVIIVSDEIEYSAGTETGRTLTLNCPWGTQEIANNILQSIKGFQYQPMTANGALIDPSAEIGDGITANNVYGGIYTMETRFGGLLRATVSAPSDEEIDHEYPYVSKQERRVTRNLRHLTSELSVQAGLISAEVAERKSETEKLTSELSVQAGQIAAKVEKTGGKASSFGWTLNDSSWTIQANNKDVLKATKNGLEVYGKVTATSGKIGGFTIASNYLSYNNQTWGGTNTTGIYVGIKGIQLGKNFTVDSNGNLTAASGTFSGTVSAGNIKYGEDHGYFSGSGISANSISGGMYGKIKETSLSTWNLTDGVNTSLGYADFTNEVFTGISTAELIGAARVLANKGDFDKLFLTFGNRAREIGYDTITINGKSYKVLTFD